jgi:hypothetical protein
VLILNTLKENVMRRLVLTVAAALLTLGAVTSGANAAPLGNLGGFRSAIDETALTEDVALRCTHWWNGVWHKRLRCFDSYPYYSYGPRFSIGPRIGGFRSFHRGGGRRGRR